MLDTRHLEGRFDVYGNGKNNDNVFWKHDSQLQSDLSESKKVIWETTMCGALRRHGGAIRRCMWRAELV